ncbi:MAG TPA: NfuA family Fe-S biogenesis protein [Xanthomonadales bacterium]|nr:NfuA family Fe-S biogenesis protein [Xanthomonadales bacterium]
MIEITPSAQEYFQHLIAQQDEPGLGLRIAVVSPGTPNAACDLQFCPAGQHGETDRILEFQGFRLYVRKDSEQWLERAEIDFDESSTGGQLSIRAPGIRGHEPAGDAPLEERIEWLLETDINPSLAAHGGKVALTEITADLRAVLRFGGGCQGCGMADVTLKQGIEKTLLAKIPELTGVLDATDHQSGSNPYYAAGTRGSSAV